MNDNNLIKLFESMRELEPRREILVSLKKRVFDTIGNNAEVPVVSPTRPTRFLIPLSGSVFTALSVAFAVILVVANQLPMHGAYQNSIASIATAEQLADSLDRSSDPAAAALDIKAATAQTRATLDTLKLKGVLGMYTATQCLNAYAIYDGYLDHLGDYLDKKIPAIKDPATLAAFKNLRAYVQNSQEEAQSRIHTYSPEK